MNIKVYQIYYNDEQLKFLDRNFIPYNNSDMDNDTIFNQREFPVMLKFKDNECTHDEQLTGFVSWKFQDKVQMTGTKLFDKINHESGYSDVYFADCGKRSCSNVWLHGEKYHPGIINFTQEIFNDLGYNIDLKNIKHSLDKKCFCNFIIGNKYFWKKYFTFVEPVFDYINNHLSFDQKKILNKQADRKIKSNLTPFIIERMFTTLIHVDHTIMYTRIK